MIILEIALAIAVAVIGGTVGAIIGIGITVSRVEARFLQLNERIENNEKQISRQRGDIKEYRIKYNALVGMHVALVSWTEKAIAIFEKLGQSYPDPPHKIAAD